MQIRQNPLQTENNQPSPAGKAVYTVTRVFYIAIAAYISISYLIAEKPFYALLGPVSLLFLLLPFLLKKLFCIQLNHTLSAFIILFCTVAFQLGVALRWYNTIWYYDVIAHLLSGVLFALLGLCLFSRQNRYFKSRGTDVFFQVCYALFFSMFIAAMWEIGEYTVWRLTGHDAQHHLDTGVVDTMEDMICALTGSLLLLSDVLLRLKAKWKTPLSSILLAFDRANSHPVKDEAI